MNAVLITCKMTHQRVKTKSPGFKLVNLILSIISILSVNSGLVYGQVGAPGGSVPHAGTMSLNNIPPGLVVNESFRKATSVFYSLPENTTIIDFDDMDKGYMTPCEKDERIVYAEDSDGNQVQITHVLDPTIQFNPQSLPYELAIMDEEKVAFFNSRGNKIHTSYFTESELNFSDPINPEDVEYEIIMETNGTMRIIYPGAELQINQNNGTVFKTIYDESGIWVIKSLEILDVEDTLRRVPLYELSIIRNELPSEKCVFRVEADHYSEYFRKSDSKEPPIYVKPGFNGLDSEHFELKAFPNPASHHVTIEIPNMNMAGVVDISIYSMEGKVIFNQSIETSSIIQLNTNSWNAGIYIIKASFNNNNWIDKLIIK